MTTAAPIAAREPASTWEWVQATLIGLNLLWTTLCLGGYRPETMATTLLLTGAALVVNFVERALGRVAVATGRDGGWVLFPFLIYAAVNVVAITPVRWLGWIDFLGWANLAAIFWLVQTRIQGAGPRRLLFIVLVGLALVGTFLACYQRFVRPDWLMLGRTQVDQFLTRSSGPFGIPNSFAAFLLLLIPAAGALAFRRNARATERVGWLWVGAVLLLGLALTVSRGGWISLAAALVLWPLVSGGKRAWRKRVVSSVVVLALVIAATAVLYETVPGVRERFGRLVHDAGEVSRPILWRAASRIFQEHPLVGGGAGSFNVLFERHRPERFRDEPQWAHNEYLNTLSDYGLVGFALIVVPVAMVVLRVRRDRHDAPAWASELELPVVRTAFGIGVAAFALQAAVDFHLKIPALALALAVVAALALGRSSTAHQSSRVQPSVAARAIGAVLTLALVITLIGVHRFYRAEGRRYAARQWVDAAARRPPPEMTPMLTRAEPELRRAIAMAPGNAAAWSDLAFAIELRAFADPAQVAALAAPAIAAAETATKLTEAVPEFWIRLGVALDMQSRRTEAAAAFEKAVKLAPRNSNAWYYYANHLSFATDRREAALRAIATCLSLDPGNGAAEALQAKINERLTGAP